MIEDVCVACRSTKDQSHVPFMPSLRVKFDCDNAASRKYRGLSQQDCWAKCTHMGRKGWQLRGLGHKMFSGTIEVEHGKAVADWKALLIHRGPAYNLRELDASLPILATVLVPFFTLQGRLRPQLHGIFGSEADQGDLLILDSITWLMADQHCDSPEAQRIVMHNTGMDKRFSAAFSCLTCTLAVTFKPGFLMIVCQTAQIVALPPGL